MYPLLPFTLNQPLAVDNAVSTIGAIHKLIKKINEVIEEVNSIDSKANEYTDAQIELLNNQLRAYINELNGITINHFNSVDNAILSNTHSIDQLQEDMNELQVSFDNLAISVTEQINTSFNAIKSYVDLQIEIVKELVKAQNPEVIDCYGHKNKLQDAYNNMFRLFKYGIGDGRFDKVLNALRTFTFSTYVNMNNVSFRSFVEVMGKSATVNLPYYISYGNTSVTTSTDHVRSFKDLLTNINTPIILIYRYSSYNALVPSSETTNYYNSLRNKFISSSQYQSVTLLNKLDDNLRKN